MANVTKILSRIESGDRSSADQLLPMIYEELRKLAAAKLADEKPGQTLQATALVHEAYLRLVEPAIQQSWDSRGHFFAAAAEAMRRILVEQARRKRRLKRGGDMSRQPLRDSQIVAPQVPDDLLALDETLDRLAAIDPQKVELVKLRFFAGLTVRQAAEALGIAPSTADRHWTYARAWIYREMAPSDDG